ncbi:MAG: hypothetical protein QM296_03365, partial [Bacillota bacterium]|nr:hypothetical protein [Bacillota bacterium]
PRFGAGKKKLSRGGQKLRWCPEIRAGTKKLSKDGQKLRWCPGGGARWTEMVIGFAITRCFDQKQASCSQSSMVSKSFFGLRAV